VKTIVRAYEIDQQICFDGKFLIGCIVLSNRRKFYASRNRLAPLKVALEKSVL